MACLTSRYILVFVSDIVISVIDVRSNMLLTTIETFLKVYVLAKQL
jgi:hypothetical protein